MGCLPLSRVWPARPRCRTGRLAYEHASGRPETPRRDDTTASAHETQPRKDRHAHGVRFPGGALPGYLDQVGIDIILVGDSLGNVVQGHETTLAVTADDMIYHAKAVMRGQHALIVVDMPFMSYQTSIDDAVRNCGRVLKEVGVGAVKLEGDEYIAEIVRHLLKIGIPVMGHLGLTPQAINNLGTIEVRATEKEEADQLLHDAPVLAEAGIFALVLEKIPADLAGAVPSAIPVPTICIGVGPHCDSQVLVVYDLLGLTEEFKPRFVRRYVELSTQMRDAFTRYIHDVKAVPFPR